MFHPLAFTDGTVLTWDRPPDHPWHHALWFSWKYLNHVNYWEEGKGAQGITGWSNVSVNRGRDFSAVIRMDLSYHELAQSAVLTEHREIRVSAPTADGQYHLDWTMTFKVQDRDVVLDRTPIPGEEKGQRFGGYAGLSIRFAKHFTDWRAVTTKGPIEPDPAQINYCVPGAVGSDFSGTVRGSEAGVAFLDHPANLNSPTPWYMVMDPQKSFSFSQAAPIYYRPHVLRARQSLELRYRVVVHGSRWNAADITAAQANYVREVKKGK